MTRAQSVDVLNDSTTLQSRIDTVLATPDLDWSNDSGWHPGDPLYERPSYLLDPGAQVIREMFEVFEDGYYFNVRCEPCQVSWGAGDTCWNCGADCPRPSYGTWAPLVTFDETHEWSRDSMRPFVEAMEGFSRSMAQVSGVFDEFRQRYTVGFDGRGRSEYAALTFALAGPEPDPEPQTWIRANSRCYLLPHVENVNAPTISETAQGEPLAEWERELLGLPDPVIRIPEDVDLTAAAPVPLPEQVSLTGRRRRPPEFQRYHFDRPVTETRRPRETR